MKHEDKIRKELENDKVYKALYSSMKPEEREQIGGAVSELIKLASFAVSGFSLKSAQSDITLEEIESAIKDRTGKK